MLSRDSAINVILLVTVENAGVCSGSGLATHGPFACSPQRPDGTKHFAGHGVHRAAALR